MYVTNDIRKLRNTIHSMFGKLRNVLPITVTRKCFDYGTIIIERILTQECSAHLDHGNNPLVHVEVSVHVTQQANDADEAEDLEGVENSQRRLYALSCGLVEKRFKDFCEREAGHDVEAKA